MGTLGSAGLRWMAYWQFPSVWMLFVETDSDFSRHLAAEEPIKSLLAVAPGLLLAVPNRRSHAEAR
jgi:hypothetical protein